MIQLGEQAPDFTLPSTKGPFRLSALQGEKFAVLLFYPKDKTPGCQQQLSAARDAASDYAGRNAQVVAINPDSLSSHQQWADEEGFDFPICVDENKQVAEAYGVLKPGGGIQRTVFIVSDEGRVVWSQEGLPATTEIMNALDLLDEPPNR
jgi:peroxiredoxin Q/BCP